METITYLSFIISVISLIYALLAYYKSKQSVSIKPNIDEKFENINLFIINNGECDISIKSIKLVYGVGPYIRNHCLFEKEFPHLSLNPGEEFTFSVERNELVKICNEKQIESGINYLLWGIVKISTGKKFFRLLNIDKSILSHEIICKHHPNDIPYISTEMFLGIPINRTPVQLTPTDKKLKVSN